MEALGKLIFLIGLIALNIYVANRIAGYLDNDGAGLIAFTIGFILLLWIGRNS